MAERSRFWGGTTTGDATVAPYDAETEFAQVMRSIAGAGVLTPDYSGVFVDELNLLAASGGVTPVIIASGRAICDGTWYENDANVNVAIPTPAVNPRIDRIVLRKGFVAQTVRVTRIAGVEAATPTAPALVQIAGTTWDQPLCQVLITTGGIITLTDERKFVGDTGSGVFGDGQDGNITIAGTTQLQRDMMYNNLTIGAAGTLSTNGYRIWVKGTLTIAAGGILQSDNGAVGQNAGGSSGGAGYGPFAGNNALDTGAGAGGFGSAGAGGPGSIGGGINATSRRGPHTAAAGGGAGGAAGFAGGAGGALTSLSLFPLKYFTFAPVAGATMGQFGGASYGAGLQPIYPGQGGSGGGGGGGDGGNSGGGGGGGGRAGGFVQIFCRILNNAGTIRSNGGAGGAGGTLGVGNVGGGGGGGGGTGGTIYIVMASLAALGTIQCLGGAGGAAGFGAGAGANGLAGPAGGAGVVIRYNIATGQWV